jgi:hypothetical protein
MPVVPLTISTITPRSRSVGMLATLAPTRLPFSSLNADHRTGCCPTVIAAGAAASDDEHADGRDHLRAAVTRRADGCSKEPGAAVLSEKHIHLVAGNAHRVWRHRTLDVHAASEIRPERVCFELDRHAVGRRGKLDDRLVALRQACCDDRTGDDGACHDHEETAHGTSGVMGRESPQCTVMLKDGGEKADSTCETEPQTYQTTKHIVGAPVPGCVAHRVIGWIDFFIIHSKHASPRGALHDA